MGNHDKQPNGLRGASVAAWRAGNLVFRHEAAEGRLAGEISGHYHPKASVPVRGAVVTRPCFVADARRVVMPALGAYTGGLDVEDMAIRRFFPIGGRAFLLGKERVFSFAFGPKRRAASSV